MSDTPRQAPPPGLPNSPTASFVAGRGGARLRAGGLSQAFPGALPQEGFPELRGLDNAGPRKHVHPEAIRIPPSTSETYKPQPSVLQAGME